MGVTCARLRESEHEGLLHLAACDCGQDCAAERGADAATRASCMTISSAQSEQVLEPWQRGHLGQP